VVVDLLLTGWSAAAPPEILIAAAGDPPRAAPIVLSARPTRSAQVAAAELRHYVQRITGAVLPELSDDAPVPDGQKILVGESALTRARGLCSEGFADQEYLVQTDGESLVLMGRDEPEYGEIDYTGTGLWPDFTLWYDWGLKPHASRGVGTVYAVHEFLRRVCGVRWYMPGELGEVCPQRATITVGRLDIRRRPWSTYRWIYPNSVYEPFHFHGSGRAPTRMAMRDVNLWHLRMKLVGIEAFNSNHSLLPQWFANRLAADEAVRADVMAKGYEEPDQLCLSSTNLLRIVCADADDYFEGRANHERSYGDYFKAMPHDNSRYCLCASCQAAVKPASSAKGFGFWSDRASDYVWGFVNRVAAHVGEAHPGKCVACCAYARYTEPPSFEVEPNVAVEICRTLNEGIIDPAYRAYYRDLLKRWSGQAGRWYIWEYFDHIQGNYHGSHFPGVFLREIADDLRFLEAHRCRGLFNELSSDHGVVPNMAQDHLNLYVQLRLLDDIALDSEGIFNEYCGLFYGPAAEPMQRFFRLLEERFTDPRLNRIDPRDSQKNYAKWARMNAWAYQCPPDVLRQFGALVADARTRAKEEPFRTRMRLIDEAVYGMMVKNCARFHVGYPCVEPTAEDASWEILGRNAGHLTNPQKIHIDGQGRIYAADWYSHQVLVYEPDGTLRTRIAVPGGARSVVTAPDGMLYVAGYRRVLTYHPDGRRACRFRNGTDYQIPSIEVDDIRDVALDAQGRIWTIGDRTLKRFTADGRTDTTWTAPASMAFADPQRLLVSDDRLLVYDRGGRRFTVFNLRTGAVANYEIPGEDPLYPGFGLKPDGSVLVAGFDKLFVFGKEHNRYVPRGELPAAGIRAWDIGYGPDGRLHCVLPNRLARIGESEDGLILEATIGADGYEKDGQFAFPLDVCVDREGSLIVCEFMRIRKFGSDGRQIWQQEAPYSCSVAVDSTGVIYAGNMTYPHITRISADGKERSTHKLPMFTSSTRGVAIDSAGRVLVSDLHGRIARLTPTLDVDESFGDAGSIVLKDGDRAVTVHRISVDGDDNLYVCAGRNGVAKFDSAGVPVRAFARGRRASHFMNFPRSWRDEHARGREFDATGGIAIDTDGSIYVAASGHEDHRIVKADGRGRYQGTFGRYGCGPGELRMPGGLALTPDGFLYVVDSANNRIYKLPKDTAFD